MDSNDEFSGNSNKCNKLMDSESLDGNNGSVDSDDEAGDSDIESMGSGDESMNSNGLNEADFNETPFRLLDLSPELLLQIIAHVVTFPLGVKPVELCDPSPTYRDQNLYPTFHDSPQVDCIFKMQPAITRTSRYLREVTLPIYYRVNDFSLVCATVQMGQPYPWLRFLTIGSTVFLRHLRKVIFFEYACFSSAASERATGERKVSYCAVMLRLIAEPLKPSIVLGERTKSTRHPHDQEEWYDRLAQWLDDLGDNVVDGISLLRAAVLIRRGVPFSRPASNIRKGFEFSI